MVQPCKNMQTSSEMDHVQSAQRDIEKGQEDQCETPARERRSLSERFSTWWAPWKITDGRYNGFKPFELESFPDGYPRLAALMDSDINTRIYKRFGLVRNRLLLHKQDQIAALFEALTKLDQEDENLHPERLLTRRHYDRVTGDDFRRSRLLQTIEETLREYDTLLLQEHAIASLPKPSNRNHRAIFDWVYNNKPVIREEYQYLYDRRDFVLLGNQHDDWQRSFQEKIWNLSFNPILKQFLSSKSRCPSPKSTYASNQKADIIIKLFLASAMTVILMLPVILLNVLNPSTGVKIAILVLFVLGFSVTILIMTQAKRHEAFAATAAYAAVLVVFLASLPKVNVS